MTTRKRVEGSYYGTRQVVYVQICEPAHRGPQKHVTVYGKTLSQVVRAVDKGLEVAFGKTAASRPSGRPKGKKKRSSRNA